MKVTVEYLGYIKRVLGNVRDDVIIKDGALVADLLSLLSDKYGDPFKKTIYEPSGADLKSNFIVTVNGYLLNQLKGVKTRLRDGDHLILMPIVSGG